LGPNVKELFRLIEDFVEVIGLRMKDFQDMYEVTDNLVLSIHKRPAMGSTDISFPMKGWRGMVDWARSSEDRVTLSKNILSGGKPDVQLRIPVVAAATRVEPRFSALSSCPGAAAGIRPPRCTLGNAVWFHRWRWPQQQSHRARSRAAPQTRCCCGADAEAEAAAAAWREEDDDDEEEDEEEEDEEDEDEDEEEAAAAAAREILARVINDGICVSSLLGSWSSRGCRAVPLDASRTRCVCDRASTFAILARLHPDTNMDKTQLPSVTLMVGCGVSSLTLLLLIIIYVSVLCTLVAAFLHFFFLSSFCWVLTEAWQSYMAVTGRLRNRIIRKRFLCLGWGLPALVVAISVGFTKAKGYGTPN
ncbi:hypothetical protein CRUP_021462, partial [Coryphaenoides rupestris]